MRFNTCLLIAFIALQINIAFSANNGTVYNYNIIASTRDLSTAQRIPNLPVWLFKQKNDDWLMVSNGKTEDNGEFTFSSTKYEYTTGIYKLRYDVRNHYNVTFYPFIDITFDVSSVLVKYPFIMLLDKYGYTIYQGVFG